MLSGLMFFAGLAVTEVLGYFYHRWIEHGEIMRFVGENKVLNWVLYGIIYRHWTHHVKNYPPGNLRPEHSYVTEDWLSWYLPGAIVTVAVLCLVPWAYAIALVLGGWTYGLFVGWLHQRFHLRRHILANNRLFLYLQRIHDIHHLDQTKNFTIVCPLLDILFGTYRGELPLQASAS